MPAAPLAAEVVPGWLQVLSALGNVAAGVAGLVAAVIATVALLLWQRQRRADRRSSAALQALAAVDVLEDAGAALARALDFFNEHGLGRAEQDARQVGRSAAYTRWFDAFTETETTALDGARQRFKETFGEARVLLPRESYALKMIAIDLNVARSGVHLARADIREKGPSEEAERSLGLAQDALGQLAKHCSAAHKLLGPVARYEETGVAARLWKRFLRSVENAGAYDGPRPEAGGPDGRANEHTAAPKRT
jgi:hypothetical protein